MTPAEVRDRRAELRMRHAKAAEIWMEACSDELTGTRLLQLECPHENTEQVDGGQYVGYYARCLDCGKDGVREGCPNGAFRKLR